jgi:hypothetical protein
VFWWDNLSDGDHIEDPDIDARILLKYILETWDGGHELDRSGSG